MKVFSVLRNDNRLKMTNNSEAVVTSSSAAEVVVKRLKCTACQELPLMPSSSSIAKPCEALGAWQGGDLSRIHNELSPV